MPRRRAPVKRALKRIPASSMIKDASGLINEQLPMAIIGIDPGQRSGLAVVTVSRNPELIYYKSVAMIAKGVDVSVTTFLKHVTDVLGGYSYLAVIEDQYVGKNARSAISLAQSAGRWTEACLYLSVAVDRMAAITWQSRELKGIRKREQLKAAAQNKTYGLWRLRMGPDASDAALMARCYAIQVATSASQLGLTL